MDQQQLSFRRGRRPWGEVPGALRLLLVRTDLRGHARFIDGGIRARSLLENVVAHWHMLIESFQTSSKDFYTSVELALDHRQIPGLKISRVKWSEGEVPSPDREYLRVTNHGKLFKTLLKMYPQQAG